MELPTQHFPLDGGQAVLQHGPGKQRQQQADREDGQHSDQQDACEQ
ncbi:hypothetical protein [Sphingobium sp. EM0848]|nr:hypothetical protein [Sphingobium sp. EM0848]